MSRIFGSGREKDPRIDERSVAAFFQGRAERIAELGPTRAVLYQDKSGDLAERRDALERRTLAPLLALDGRQRVLDIGCGTGRWVSTLAPNVTRYHGVDFAPGLIAFARETFRELPQVAFSVASATEVTLDLLGETEAFDRILSSGLLIYLNEEQVRTALERMRDCFDAENGRILLREPVAQGERLTILEHYSHELEAEYNAIYRTRQELLAHVRTVFSGRGVGVLDHGFVFDDPDLNNRGETRQEWFLLGGRP